MDQSNNQQTKQLPAMSPEIRAFIEGLVEDAKLSNIDESMKEQLVEELYVRLDNYIASVIVENMPPEHLEEFIKMNEQGKSQQEVQQFFTEKLPNAGDVMASALLQFREMYLGNQSADTQNPPTN